MPDLSVTLGRLTLRNPILAASGTFGYAREMEPFVDFAKLGGIVPKTVTQSPRAGNAPPRTVETASGMLNAIGLDNDGLEHFLSHHLPYLRTLPTAILGNIAGKTEDEFAAMARRIGEAGQGLAGLELNLSCPNVSGGLDFATNPEVARRIVALGSITYVGNHGTEVLRGGATEVEVDPEVSAWVVRVRAWAAAAQTAELDRLRVRAEDKEAIAAFHWRGAPDETAAEATVRTLAERAEAEGFHTHWGRKVLEVRPPLPIDKGRGIVRLVGDEGLAVALYAGDDSTDLDAFAGLRALVADGRLGAALCVGVRSDETPPELDAAADLMVDGPAGVRELLVALAA